MEPRQRGRRAAHESRGWGVAKALGPGPRQLPAVAPILAAQERPGCAAVTMVGLRPGLSCLGLASARACEGRGHHHARGGGGGPGGCPGDRGPVETRATPSAKNGAGRLCRNARSLPGTGAVLHDLIAPTSRVRRQAAQPRRTSSARPASAPRPAAGPPPAGPLRFGGGAEAVRSPDPPPSEARARAPGRAARPRRAPYCVRSGGHVSSRKLSKWPTLACNYELRVVCFGYRAGRCGALFEAAETSSFRPGWLTSTLRGFTGPTR
jgi:hypothetical protein